MTARAAESETWIRSIERRSAEVRGEALAGDDARAGRGRPSPFLCPPFAQLEESHVRCLRCGEWAPITALVAGAGTCPNRACGRAVDCFRLRR